MKVYLCGGINGLTDSECMDWRELAKRELGEENCIDPMRRDYRGVEHDNVVDIVEGDLADLDRATILLVNASRPSWGTAMEVFYFRSLGCQLSVAFVGPGTPVSPWLRYHVSVIVETPDEAVYACRLWLDAGGAR